MSASAALFYSYPIDIEGEVFGQGRRERIAALADLYPHVINADNFDEHAAQLADVEVIFATWGMFPFAERHFAAMPRLKAVFYAAGNVRNFAQPLIDRGVTLVGAWDINAIPTADTCLAQTLLSLRGYFRTVRNYRDRKTLDARHFPRSGINGETVGLLGLGKIATRFRRHLARFPLKVIVYDPFLTESRAQALDVESAPLDEIFTRAMVVSNHMPDLPETRVLLTRRHFMSMRDSATFINTGRGAQVVEEDLIAVLRDRPDLTALLDVTWPEPPAADSPFWKLPNVILSGHYGGSVGDEVVRMADCMIAEFESWRAGRPLRYEITAEIFKTMG